MGTRYLVVSDLHLADVEDHADSWKAHKGSRFVFDEDFRSLVRHFVEHADEGDQLTLVLNGDIIDFDLVTAVPDTPPWPVSSAERRRGLDATEPKSAWKLERALADHPVFLATLAEFIAAGHRVVYVVGNHDRELHFPQVQECLINAIEQHARAEGRSLLRGTIQFEAWFFYVPGEIFAEHGQQYDYYTSFRYLLAPTVTMDGEQRIALPMGNLSNRYLMSHMGYFNPHSGEFILNLFSYLFHWLRYYAFSRRSLMLSWFIGSLLVIGKLLKIKRHLHDTPAEHTAQLQRIARKYDLSQQAIEQLGKLQRPPITHNKMYRALRELWIDRVLIALLMTGGTITLALVNVPLWVKLMVPLSGFPLLYFIYEYFAQGETIFTIEREFPQHARAVAGTLPARVVTFGHTHYARVIPLSKSTTFVDTGTWAPITTADRKKLVPGMRNYLSVSFIQGTCNIELGSWMEDR